MKRRALKWVVVAAVTFSVLAVVFTRLLTPFEEVRFSPWTLQYQTREVWVFLSREAVVYRMPWQETPNEVVAYLHRTNFVPAVTDHDPEWLYLKNELHEDWTDTRAFPLNFLGFCGAK